MKYSLYFFSALLLLAISIGCAKDDLKSDFAVEQIEQNLTILDSKRDFSLHLHKSKTGEISHEADAIESFDHYFKKTIEIPSTAFLKDSEMIFNGRNEFFVFMTYENDGKNLSTLIVFGVSKDLSDTNFTRLVPKETHTCTGDPCVKCELVTEEVDGKKTVKGCSCELASEDPNESDGHCNHSVSIEI